MYSQGSNPPPRYSKNNARNQFSSTYPASPNSSTYHLCQERTMFGRPPPPIYRPDLRVPPPSFYNLPPPNFHNPPPLNIRIPPPLNFPPQSQPWLPNNSHSYCNQSQNLPQDEFPTVSSIEGCNSTSETPTLACNHPLSSSTESFTKSQKLVNEWVQNKIKNPSKKRKSDHHDTPSSLQDVHEDVFKFKQYIKDLDVLSKKSDAQSQLSKLSSKISTTLYKEQVMKLVNERRKKRARQKRSKIRRQKMYTEMDKKIDEKRLMVIKSEIETRKVEQFQREADSVLRQVKAKTSETFAMKKLLEKMTTLRESRVKRGEQQGYVTSQVDDDYFTKVTDGLMEMLSDHQNDYYLEERTLQGLIEQHQSTTLVPQEKKSERKSSGVTTQDIHEIYFGSDSPEDISVYQSYTAANTSTELLNYRRNLWNKHLNSEGSELPVQWEAPLSGHKEWDRWRRSLQHSTNSSLFQHL